MHPKQRLFALVAGLVIVVAAIWYFLRRAATDEAAPATVSVEAPAPASAASPPPAPGAGGRTSPKEEPVAEDVGHA